MLVWDNITNSKQYIYLMEYDVWKKIEEHLQFIIKLATADIMIALGKMDKTYWSKAELNLIIEGINEKVEELDDLNTSFVIELNLNSIEEKEKLDNYYTSLLEKLNNYRDAFSKMFEFWNNNADEKKSTKKIIEIKLITTVIETIEDFIYIVHEYKFPLVSEETFSKTSLILYLHYSKLLEEIQTKLKSNFSSGNISSRRVGETVAKIIGSSKNFPSPIISGIGSLSSSHPYEKITKSILEEAKKMLIEDHFDTTSINQILQNWKGKD